MKVSVIGTGRMGKGLVKVLSPHLQTLQWGSRSIDKVRGLVEELNVLNVQPVESTQALEADVIIHSLWFRDLIPCVLQHKHQLKGKILVDIVNPFNEDFSDFTLDWGTSAAEKLQSSIPDTKVVGAFKNTFFSVFDNPIHQNLVSDVYVTSNHEDAKNTVLDLLQGIPFRLLDAGALSNNRVIERMTLFEREVSIRYGHYPYVSYRLFGLDQ